MFEMGSVSRTQLRKNLLFFKKFFEMVVLNKFSFGSKSFCGNSIWMEFLWKIVNYEGRISEDIFSIFAPGDICQCWKTCRLNISTNPGAVRRACKKRRNASSASTTQCLCSTTASLPSITLRGWDRFTISSSSTKDQVGWWTMPFSEF